MAYKNNRPGVAKLCAAREPHVALVAEFAARKKLKQINTSTEAYNNFAT